MSYLLHMLIYICMILLNNLLQCLLFITMIDLSRTCDSTVALICNALIMFMIYPWIKIRLKMLLFPTIQKHYCSHFSFMTGFIDALKSTSFTGVNFKRWQMWVTLWLTDTNVFWVSEGKSDGELALKRRSPIQKVTQSFMVRWLEYLQRLYKICTFAIKSLKRCGIS
jgi:hypothetical protein